MYGLDQARADHLAALKAANDAAARCRSQHTSDREFWLDMADLRKAQDAEFDAFKHLAFCTFMGS